MHNDKQSLRAIFYNGVISENPTFRLVLGICPTLASTTSLRNALGMGVAVIFVLVGPNAVISLLRRIIPDKVRIPSFIVVICTFVTIVKLLIQAYVPFLYEELGVFIPLIVVNCIILARAEAFASKNGVLPSVIDGLGMGVGFTLAISLISVIRELIGAGTLFGFNILGSAYQPMTLLVLAPGGFITFGVVLAVVNRILASRKKEPVRCHGCAGCAMEGRCSEQ